MEKDKMIYPLKFNIMEYVWVIYFVSTYIFGMFFKYTHYVATVVLLFMTLIYVKKRGYKFLKDFFKILLVFFILYIFIFASLSWVQGKTTEQKTIIISMIETYIMMFCIGGYMKDKEKIINFSYAFVISTVIMGIVYYLTSPIDTWGTTEMGTKLSIWRNSAGYYFCFAALFSIYLYYIGVKKRRLLFFATFLVIAAVGTGSRKIFIQLFLFFVLFIVFQSNFKKVVKNILIFGVLGVIVIIIAMKIPFIRETYANRLMSIFQGINSSDGSTVVRTLMIQLAFELFLENPLIGAGIDGFKIWFGKQYQILERWNLNEGMYSHCNYVELLANFGIVGFLLYYYYPIKLVLVNLKNRDDKFCRLGLITIITYLVLDFATISYCYRFYIAIFCIGIVSVIVGENKNCDKGE